MLGDFLLQTRGMVERKTEARFLLAHTAVVLAAHAALVLPFVHWHRRDLAVALGLLGSLAALHALVDVGKVRWKRWRERDSVGLFLLDQAAHAGVILGIWSLWRTWLGSRPGPLAPAHLTLLAALALVVAVYVLNGNGAAVLIKLFLDRFDLVPAPGSPPAPAGTPPMGWTIGILERMLLLSLILLGRWEAVGWVFAAKTVARFRELDDRTFSEYYIIGTLSSLLFAAATGTGLRLALTGGF